MDSGKGRVVGRARGRPAPPAASSQMSGPGGLPVSPPAIQPQQELYQPPGFQHPSAPQPASAVGGRAAVRGNGQMRAGADDISSVLSHLSMDTESTHGSSAGREVVGAAGDGPRSRRGMGVEVIRYRPTHLANKKGDSGNRVSIITNLFRLVRKADFSFHHFNVTFNPEIVNPRIRKGMIYQLRDKFGCNYIFDGTSLYLPINLEKPEMEYALKRITDDMPIIVRIRHVAVLSPSSPVCIQVFNIIFKKVLNHIGLQMMQRNYYNPHQAFDIPKHRLSIWPGYITSILQYETETSLIADVSHKILSTETILQRLYNIHRANSRNFEEQSKAELVGCIILTRYNNKTYKIDDIDWDKHPTDTFELRNKEKQSYIDYYKAHHGITIRDMAQPLIIVLPSKRERRTGQEGPICVIPELCYMTGLAESTRKDMNVMRDLADHTRIEPQDRVKTLRGFLHQIHSNENAMRELNNWNMGLDNDLMEIAARVLKPEVLVLGAHNRNQSQNEIISSKSADWSREMKDFRLLQPGTIKNWVYIFTERDAPIAQNFGQLICNMSRNLGMNIASFNQKILTDGNVGSYMRALKETVNSRTEFVMIILPSARADLYSSIKKYLCVDAPVPSQVMLPRTISQPRKIASVAGKVLIQINSKLGNESWAVKIPLKDTMVIGIDSYHDTQRRGSSVMGVVASLNKNFNRYYTSWIFQSNREEIGRGLNVAIVAILKKYKDVNEKLPEQIIIYRDGVGDGQLHMVMNFEVTQIMEAFSQFGTDYKPLLTVVVVTKRVNSRFFLNDGQNIENPLPGTIIDSGATRPEWFDFFVISQSVGKGTVTPTHYNVILHQVNLTPDRMQQLTYKLCHLYYNWQGTIRVPAPCMYAHKVAFLIGQSLHVSPSTVLADKLFYL